MANSNFQESGSGFNAHLDNRLLEERGEKQDGAKKSSSQKVGDLREAQRGQNQAESELASDEATNLRLATMAARRHKALVSSDSKESGLSEMTPLPVRKGTSQLLRSAWINLIPSWGLTLIWINIHIFLGMVLGNKYFCKLGVEWSDQVSGSMAKSGEVKKKLDEKAGNSIGLVEKIGVGCADLGCLFLLIAIAALIALLLQVIENPLAFLSESLGYVWDEARGGIVRFFSSE